MKEFGIILAYVVIFATVFYLQSYAKRNPGSWVRLLFSLRYGSNTDVARMTRRELFESGVRFLTWGLIFASAYLLQGMLFEYLYGSQTDIPGPLFAVFALTSLISAMGFFGGAYLLLRGLFRSKSFAHASLDSVSFNTSRYQLVNEEKGGGEWFNLPGSRRVWISAERVCIILAFREGAPTLPQQVGSRSELESYYLEHVCDKPGTMVEFRPVLVSWVHGIWMVVKIPREPHGNDYLGVLTIPYSKFTFDVGFYCEEEGTTGIREAVLLQESLTAGTVKIDADGKMAGDWNPDDARHDTRFPDHPLSRLRHEAAIVRSSLRIDEAIRDQARPELPAVLN